MSLKVKSDVIHAAATSLAKMQDVGIITIVYDANANYAFNAMLPPTLAIGILQRVVTSLCNHADRQPAPEQTVEIPEDLKKAVEAVSDPAPTEDVTEPDPVV